MGLVRLCSPWLLHLLAQSGLGTVGHSTRLRWQHFSHSPAKVMPLYLGSRKPHLREGEGWWGELYTLGHTWSSTRKIYVNGKY